MTHCHFLQRLIAEAIRIWCVHPADMHTQSHRSAGVARAKCALVIIAYRYGCTPEDITAALGWRRWDRHYNHLDITIRHAHLLLLADQYVGQFERLERYARTLTGSIDPHG